MPKKPIIITFFEYSPHMMGDSTALCTMTLPEFDSLVAAAKEYIADDNDDQYGPILECLEARAGNKTIFSMYEALSGKGPAKIRKHMLAGKVYADKWEEGSFPRAQLRAERPSP